MKLIGALGFAGLLGMAVTVYGSSFVIDNFSCADSVSLAGASGFNSSYISCPGSIGGEREDFILVGGGSDTSLTTMNSNPPTGAITGTFGSGIDAYEGMVWSGSTTGWDL
jgi:hypothetical protein